jgi:hypothetical protein
MVFNWGDESAHIHNMASKVPYDYEKEYSVKHGFDSTLADGGLLRIEAKAIVASSIAALLILSSFIHADEVKDGIAKIPGIVQEIVTFPLDLLTNVEEGLNNFKR